MFKSLSEAFHHGVQPESLLSAWRSEKASNAKGVRLGSEFSKLELNLGEFIESTSGALLDGSWRPSALRKVVLNNRSGVRVLNLPPLSDRIVERSIAQAFEKILDKRLAPCSYAYRDGLSVGDAVESVLEFKEEHSWVVRADFDNCFETLSHSVILKYLSSLGLCDVVESFVDSLLGRYSSSKSTGVGFACAS